MTREYRNVSTMHHIIALILLFSCMGAIAKPAVVTASAAEIEKQWLRYRLNSTGVRPTTSFPHQQCFDDAAAAHDVPVSLLLAVARGESNFERTATSKANALGVMQILWPGTAKELGLTRKEQLFDPCTNIDAGSRYLKKLLTRYDGNVHLALAAYNYGPGRIERNADRIPSGAAWYSGYILNHMEYVLGRSAPSAERRAPARYTDEKRHTLLTFWSPERALAFVAYLRQELPSVRLDWFDRGLGRFSVDLLYQDAPERRQAEQALRVVGIRI